MDWVGISQIGFGSVITVMFGYATTQVVSARKIAEESRDSAEKRIEEIERNVSKWVLATEKSVSDIRVATEATLNMLRMDQHGFQLKAVENFASLRALREVEERIMKSLDGLDEKIDKMIERQIEGAGA